MEDIIKKLKQGKEEFIQKFDDLKSKGEILKQDIDALNSQYIKKLLPVFYRELKNISEAPIKKDIGRAINEFKAFVEDKIDTLKSSSVKDLPSDDYDVTIFKDNIKLGTSHPLVKFYKKIEKVLLSMGFSVVQGPEIELDRYNFEKLNIPSHHPARDMQDTFYVSVPNIMLRSHTSSVQVRTMEKSKPPIQIISPGLVYRVDDIDPQHTPMFFQIEGLVVDEGISFANLKAVLIKLLKEVFGQNTRIRFRPTYYPYTEPSAAVDMMCSECGGKGCRTCGHSGWIVVLGSGMVHPNVFKEVDIDYEKYTGFAFGLGLDRLAMLYYGMAEIRKFYENDVSLWRQL